MVVALGLGKRLVCGKMWHCHGGLAFTAHSGRDWCHLGLHIDTCTGLCSGLRTGGTAVAPSLKEFIEHTWIEKT